MPAKSFQSTLPARGATPGRMEDPHDLQISIHAPRTGSDERVALVMLPAWDFNPRSPHGERHRIQLLTVCKCRFQSTLPARGATEIAYIDLSKGDDFNPRSPHGERHRAVRAGLYVQCISIHAPRTGSDTKSTMFISRTSKFQSTLPARGATDIYRRFGRLRIFQSTLPARGATG